MATQGSITTATLPFGYGLSALLLHNRFSSQLYQRQLPTSVAHSHAVLALARG